MRSGFTTGSCAAAATGAAAYMLLSGATCGRRRIMTPKGTPFDAEILAVERRGDSVRCAVRKDGGDDPDVTTGALVFSEVTRDDLGPERVLIDGGEGVGRVTKPGLDQPVGAAAINSVPRAMIEKEARQVMSLFDYRHTLRVVISVPGGEEIARSTFNPRLGVEGGVSILGTSGVVEPMSVQAILDTIRVELRQNRASGRSRIVVVPGNYGLDFLRDVLGYDPERAVRCSNYIGATLDMAAELGFREILLCGSLGKLVKASGGIMNTHSHEADCRMELVVAAALVAGASNDALRRILECVSTDAAYEIVRGEKLEEPFMRRMMERIDFYLKKRAAGRIDVECMVFTKTYGALGSTPGAEAALARILEETS